jgi:HK97 family phage prohead protease
MNINFQDKYKHLSTQETPIFERAGESCLFRATPTEVIPVADTNNVFKFIITTNNIDRYGDIVEPSGLDATDYMKNPVFLFNHIASADMMPIGKCLSLTPNETGIIGETQIHDLTPLAKDALTLVQNGYLSAVSIGFRPTEWESIPQEGSNDGWSNPRRYTKWNLLEYSLVNIPANPYALITNGFFTDVRKAMDNGIITAESAIVKNIANLIERGVSSDLKKAIENEFNPKQKFQFSITKRN